jgi:hypothetical protein
LTVEVGEDVVGGLVQANGRQYWSRRRKSDGSRVMGSVTLAKSPPRNAWRSTIKKHLDQVEPERQGRGAVQLDARVLGKPGAYLFEFLELK